MSQPLFHSRQIQHMGGPISWEAWARHGRVRLQHVRDLILSGASQTQPVLQQEISLLLDSMPSSWAAHLCGPSPQPTHLASADPGDSRIFSPDAEGQLVHSYTVTVTAALIRFSSWTGTPPGLDVHATPACALELCAADADEEQAPAQPQADSSPHLVGAWEHGAVDPRSWGFGTQPAHEYVVRTRASRLRTLRRIIAGLPDAVSAMRPAIWPAQYGDEHSGIRRLKSRWEAAWALRSQPQYDQPGARPVLCKVPFRHSTPP